jgi:hypothetical protein
VHLVLTGLPAVAACLLAARAGVRQVPVLLAIGLAACAAVGLLGFWTFYGNQLIGETFFYLVVGGSLLITGWLLTEGRIEGELLRRLAVPALLWALGSCFLLMLGFLHGGADTPLAASAGRFSHGLPGDNLIPRFYAEWFFENGHHGTPTVVASWHFSDRPPLQTGFALFQRPIPSGGSELNYQALGVVLQQLWIVGLWALLVAARVGRVTRALAMVAVLLSDIAIVNGFYVWPKMLPAALLLGAAALVMTPLWTELRRSLWGAALVAALFALAMLGHGSAVFGVIPLAVVAAWRGLPSWRWIGVGLAVGIVMMVPWFAYQSHGDPPGNRLTKWTLAGVIGEKDNRGVLEATIDSYREDGFDRVVDHKRANFEAMAGIAPTRETFDTAFDNGGLEELVRAVRGVSFFYLLPSMWLLLLAPLAMAAAWKRGRRNPEEWSFALTCLAVFAIGAVAWGLISFGNLAARTIIHVGTYMLPVLGICGAVVGLRAVFPRFALYFVGANALLGLAVYAPAFDPLPETAYSPLAAVLAALALAGFVALALRGDGDAGSVRPAGEPAAPVAVASPS